WSRLSRPRRSSHRPFVAPLRELRSRGSVYSFCSRWSIDRRAPHTGHRGGAGVRLGCRLQPFTGRASRRDRLMTRPTSDDPQPSLDPNELATMVGVLRQAMTRAVDQAALAEAQEIMY